MFVFATSAVGLLVLCVLGFAKGLLDLWGSLVTSHTQRLFKAKSLIHGKASKLLFRVLRYLRSMFLRVILMQVGGGLNFSTKSLGFKWNKLILLKG